MHSRPSVSAQTSDQASVFATFGHVLKKQRELQNLSCADIGKKIGLSTEQVQALEEGRHEAFKKTAQPVGWFLRLYAKKLGMDLPMDSKGPFQAGQTPSMAVQAIPAFLLKPNLDNPDGH